MAKKLARFRTPQKGLPPRQTGKGCWYKIYTYECVLCGAGEQYRERQWTARPKDPTGRYRWSEFACDSHFL